MAEMENTQYIVYNTGHFYYQSVHLCKNKKEKQYIKWIVGFIVLRVIPLTQQLN